jgi:hypothetical protein
LSARRSEKNQHEYLLNPSGLHSVVAIDATAAGTESIGYQPTINPFAGYAFGIDVPQGGVHVAANETPTNLVKEQGVITAVLRIAADSAALGNTGYATVSIEAASNASRENSRTTNI